MRYVCRTIYTAHEIQGCNSDREVQERPQTLCSVLQLESWSQAQRGDKREGIQSSGTEIPGLGLLAETERQNLLSLDKGQVRSRGAHVRAHVNCMNTRYHRMISGDPWDKRERALRITGRKKQSETERILRPLPNEHLLCRNDQATPGYKSSTKAMSIYSWLQKKQ